jgi:hypothetical protein
MRRAASGDSPGSASIKAVAGVTSSRCTLPKESSRVGPVGRECAGAQWPPPAARDGRDRIHPTSLEPCVCHSSSRRTRSRFSRSSRSSPARTLPPECPWMSREPSSGQAGDDRLRHGRGCLWGMDPGGFLGRVRNNFRASIAPTRWVRMARGLTAGSAAALRRRIHARPDVCCGSSVAARAESRLDRSSARAPRQLQADCVRGQEVGMDSRAHPPTS